MATEMLGQDRGERNMAVLLDENDLEGIFVRGLNVPHGRKAVLLRGGAVEAVLPPGYHAVTGLADRLANFIRGRSISALIVRDSEFDVSLNLGGPGRLGATSGADRILSSDNLELAVQFLLRLQIAKPDLFAKQMVDMSPADGKRTEDEKGTVDASVQTVADGCRREITGMLQARLKEVAAEKLHGNERLRAEIESEVRDHLRKWLEARGIEIVRVSFIGFDSQLVDQHRKAGESVWLKEKGEEIAQREQDVLYHKMIRDVRRVLFSNETKAEELEGLDKLYERQRAAQGGDLQTQQRLEILMRTIKEEVEDHRILRKFFQDKKDLLDNRELRILGLDGDALVKEAEIKIQDAAHRFDLNEAGHTDTLENLRAGGRLGREKGAAEQEEAIRKLRHAGETARARDELGLHLDELTAKSKLADQAARSRIDREKIEMEERLRIRREDDLAREAQRARLIGEVSAAGSEGLIAFTDDPAKAALFAELRKLDLLKGLSEEQILAIKAAESPAVADALKEKFKALGNDRMFEMYERLLTEQDRNSAQHERASAQLLDLGKAALSAQSETASGVAAGAGPKSDWGMGQGRAGGAPGSAGAAMICPKCNTPNPPHANHCGNCGKQLRGE